MKFGVLIFPGSNCDHDMVYTLKNILNHDVVELWHKDSDLQNVDAIAIPGGFSFGDYLRSGAIARYSPIMESVIEFANNGGFVFGICNGFQILCETGLLPGALLHNDNQKFICKNVYLKADNNNNSFTQFVDSDKALKIPIAHGEGKYFADNETLKEIKNNGQILFQYCDEDGNITNDVNPNGSADNIAGICNKNKNVYGMMPHPERAADITTGNIDGLEILKSMIKSIEEQNK